jgi:hypothetical protein
MWKQPDMLHSAEHYELESTRALQAAEQANSVGQRIRLLQKAHEYAKMASAERRRSNVYEFSSHRR